MMALNFGCYGRLLRINMYRQENKQMDHRINKSTGTNDQFQIISFGFEKVGSALKTVDLLTKFFRTLTSLFYKLTIGKLSSSFSCFVICITLLICCYQKLSSQPTKEIPLLPFTTCSHLHFYRKIQQCSCI